MNKQSTLNKKLLRAREALDAIVSRMLEINKAKRQHQNPILDNSNWREELRFLNQIAEMQARLIRTYEAQLLLL